MIVCEKLTRKYGPLIAANEVSFRIDRGEIVGLLGHNGAGKTTIMKMMTGYMEPTSGRVTVNGQDVAEHRQWAQSQIGYLPENGPLYHDMTVYDFLAYTADLRGLPESRRESAVRDAMKKTELTSKASHLIQTLSRGYRQRVGVAQAILHRPPLLILDEPTNGLDPSQVQHMRSLIRDLAREATVVLSTHILQEVEAVCSRVIIVSNGRLVLDQSLADITRGERLLLALDLPTLEAVPLLETLPGVASVEPQGHPSGKHCYALASTDPLADLAPRAVRWLTERGVAIYALTPERRTLETVFRDAHESTEKSHA